MKSEEWKKVEVKLESFYTSVKLDCDGYEVTLKLERMGQFKNVIAVYVNGSIKGKWYLEDCEERRRFFKPTTRSMFSQKDKKEAYKKLSKKLLKEMEERFKYTTYQPYWTSFKSLKSHLIKNNNVIELIAS
ncbi:hypothetical protein [Alkaliphilus metalliredigens]|nr:hypothetical protein [Alkaliphilus metalliredigens]